MSSSEIILSITSFLSEFKYIRCLLYYLKITLFLPEFKYIIHKYLFKYYKKVVNSGDQDYKLCLLEINFFLLISRL